MKNVNIHYAKDDLKTVIMVLEEIQLDVVDKSDIEDAFICLQSALNHLGFSAKIETLRLKKVGHYPPKNYLSIPTIYRSTKMTLLDKLEFANAKLTYIQRVNQDIFNICLNLLNDETTSTETFSEQVDVILNKASLISNETTFTISPDE